VDGTAHVGGHAAARPPLRRIPRKGARMSLMDTLKEKLGMSKGKADDMVREHGDKIDQTYDKAGHAVDQKTGGKHSSQIDSGVEKAKDATHDYGERGRDSGA
jgi:hypothetical protein